MSRHGKLIISLVAGALMALTVATPAAADTTPPPTPEMPRIIGITATQVILNWTPGRLTEPTGWRVFRNGQQVTQSAGSAYTDRNLTPGAWYEYYIVAYDRAGNTSPPTRTMRVQTRGPGVVPQGVTNVVATDVDPGRVQLQFTMPDDAFDVSAYEVYDGPTMVLRVWASFWTGLPATAIVRHLTPGSNHSFSVQAQRTIATPRSNTIAVTTPNSADATAPSTPGGLSVTEDRYGCTFVEVRYQASSDNADPASELDYEILVDGALSETVRNQTTVRAIYVGSSGTRTVSVRAIDSSGNVSASASRQYTVDPYCSE